MTLLAPLAILAAVAVAGLGIAVAVSIWRTSRRVTAGAPAAGDLDAYLSHPRFWFRMSKADRHTIWQAGSHEILTTGVRPPAYDASLLITWLRQGEDPRLLAAAARAGATGGELVAHVEGRQRLTLDEVTVLAALRSTP